MHAASHITSDRLRGLLVALSEAGQRGLTSADIREVTGSCAPGTDVSELRHGLASTGRTVISEYVGKSPSGRKVWRYRLGSLGSSSQGVAA